MSDKNSELRKIASFLRFHALTMSTRAGSGHPTSSLSAADLMAGLIGTTFRYDFSNPKNPANDRLVFSKGHATPLYYALFAAMGAITLKDLEGYRKSTSILEGHPTFRFPYAEAATGSLGQGLSIGVGLALGIRTLFNPPASPAGGQPTSHNPQPNVFVLLGDGETAEGSFWEALACAWKYKLDNLVGILDVNRLGQSEETMYGHDIDSYRKRIEAFGWETLVIDGHDFADITKAYEHIGKVKDKPYMIIAKTFKGAGISFLQDKDNWHGKPLPADMLEKALAELGPVDQNLRVKVKQPESRIKNQEPRIKKPTTYNLQPTTYKIGDSIATRKAYGEALAKFGRKYTNVVSLDGDVKNSTYAEIFKAAFPDRFFEMYIAEQNMIGVAVGLSRMGKIPFVSTFGAFLTRAYDQIRMGALSGANVKIVGSHAGVSIGEDGPSQMALEDLSMFRAVSGSTVLYPADAVATEALVEQMITKSGICFMRTTRPNTPVIYKSTEKFPIGGSKTHRLSPKSLKELKLLKKIVIIGAGITLYEALKAQGELVEKGIEAIVVDCYSVKPIDIKTLRQLVQPTTYNLQPTTPIITVEDHWFEGGLGDAVLNVFAQDPKVKVYKLSVTQMPRSAKPAELLSMMGIDSASIVKTAKKILS